MQKVRIDKDFFYDAFFFFFFEKVVFSSKNLNLGPDSKHLEHGNMNFGIPSGHTLCFLY